MLRKRQAFVTAVLCAVAGRPACAQAPQLAVLDIEYENGVNYFGDLADPSRFATSSDVVSATVRNFLPFIGVDDIVSVNGKPAKGTLVASGRLTLLASNPMPGQGIGDIGRGAEVDVQLEILQSEGIR